MESEELGYRDIWIALDEKVQFQVGNEKLAVQLRLSQVEEQIASLIVLDEEMCDTNLEYKKGNDFSYPRVEYLESHWHKIIKSRTDQLQLIRGHLKNKLAQWRT